MDWPCRQSEEPWPLVWTSRRTTSCGWMPMTSRCGGMISPWVLRNMDTGTFLNRTEISVCLASSRLPEQRWKGTPCQRQLSR